MANPYKDEKSGKFISKADWKLQEKMRKSALENLKAQEESLRIQKEIAAANKAGNTDLAKQLQLERAKNIELQKQLKAQEKQLQNQENLNKKKNEETQHDPATSIKAGNEELLESQRIQDEIDKKRWESLSADEKQIDLAKLMHEGLKNQKGARKEAISLSQQIIDDMSTEATLAEEASDRGEKVLRSEDELVKKISDSKRMGKDLSFEIAHSEGEAREYLQEQQREQQGLLSGYEDELKERERINDAMGIMDNIMMGLEDIPFLKQFYDGEEAVHEMEQSLAKGETAGKGLWKYMKSMAGDAWDIALSWITFDSVRDVGKFLFQTMLQVSETTATISKDMGLSALAASGMRVKMAEVARESGKMHITTQDTLEAMNTLNAQWGVASGVIREDVVGEIANLTKTTGMSAEAAGRFATTMMASGQAASLVTENARETVRQTANEFGVRLNVTKTLEEAGKITGEMAANMGYNVVAITKAVATAKQLGMTLEGVAASGKKMLDFQSSIEAELQAELFTGKQLNLEKARLAALTGDYETLSKEINKNMATEHEWTKMNVLQKEKMAAALGMSSDQMSDIIYQGKNLAALAAEARENGDYAAAQDLEKRSMAEQMNDLTMKASSILVDYVAPALDVVANMMQGLADNSGLMYTLLAGMAVIKLGGLISGALSLASALAAVSSFSIATMSAWTLGIGALAIIGAIVAINAAASKAKAAAQADAKAEDAFITPEEGLLVKGPKGTIQLHEDDEIIAGTDLFGEKSKPKTPTVPTEEESIEQSIINQNITKNISFLPSSLEKDKEQEQKSPVIHNITKNIVSVMPTGIDTSGYIPEKIKPESLSKNFQDLSVGPTKNPITKDQQDLSVGPTEELQSSISPIKTIDDGIIDSDGTVVSSPKGSIQLDPEDQIATGTNLGGDSAGREMDRKNYAREERFQAESIALLKRISVATAASGMGSFLASISYSGFDAVKADTHYGTKFR